MRGLVPLPLVLLAALAVPTSVVHAQGGAARWRAGPCGASRRRGSQPDRRRAHGPGGKPDRLSGPARGLQCRARQHPARRGQARRVRLQDAGDPPAAAGLHAARLFDRPQVSGALSATRPGQYQHRMGATGAGADHRRQPDRRRQDGADDHRLPQRQRDRDPGGRKAGRPHAGLLWAALSRRPAEGNHPVRGGQLFRRSPIAPTGASPACRWDRARP